jgi:aminoglycoside/choline kinase family phosphotransferase
MKIDSIQDVKSILTDQHQSVFPSAKLLSIEQIAGDMSPRRYFRLKDSDGRTTVAMVFDSRAVPEAESQISVDSYESVVGLTDYLLARGVPVPRIITASEELGIILEEDFGEEFLAGVVAKDRARARPVYLEAIDCLVRLQTREHDQNFFALKRGFSAASYLKEMEETRDYYLPWKGLQVRQELLDQLTVELGKLAERVASLPRALALRDYHCWNIMLPRGSLGVIDFQDALLASRCYDVVALLNDRDTDSLLGEELYEELLEYFFSQHPAGEELRTEYPLTLLQRDLKVLGRFAKMKLIRGLTYPEVWIPGTARRIRKTLEKTPGLSELLEVLLEIEPEFGRS